MTSTLRELLLRQLSDGRFHSGEHLAGLLGVTRTAVWKQIQKLVQELELPVSAVRGRGYRLDGPLELLDMAAIRREIGTRTDACLDKLTLLGVVTSTNTCAAEDPPPGNGCARVWLAEHQTAGRGRRGRHWVSSFGSNIYLSLAWRFELPMNELQGLSLAAGVVVAEVLYELGCRGHSLKWPNDILVDGRKLAGILVEVSGEAGGPATAIIGVGVNVSVPAAPAQGIDQPWTDLNKATGGAVSRNRLAGMLIDGLIQACRQFAVHRLTPFVPRWARHDLLRGHDVRLIRGEDVIEGIYLGISASGAMILRDCEDAYREHHAGEVSLRFGTDK